MNKPFDIKDVDAAMQRAARKAVHGTREDKAGRFYPEPKPQAVKESAPASFQTDDKSKR